MQPYLPRNCGTLERWPLVRGRSTKYIDHVKIVVVENMYGLIRERMASIESGRYQQECCNQKNYMYYTMQDTGSTSM